MKNFLKRLMYRMYLVLVAVTMTVFFVSSSFAVFVAPTIDTADIMTVAGVIFAALALIWPIKKLIKTLTHS